MKTINDLKPSVFAERPRESVLQKTELEIVAQNIMKIRKRLGDKWPLTKEEYESERKKDGGFGYLEASYFDDVIKLIPDAVGAISFSATWAESARKALNRDK